MTTHSHPDHDLLLDFASGAMAQAPRLLVRSHMDRCAQCRQDVRILEHAGGLLLAALPEIELTPGVLGRAALAVNQPGRAPAPNTPKRLPTGYPELPPGVAKLAFRPRRWLAPGAWVARARTSADENWRLYVVRLPAGGSIPTHRHRGEEYVAVLEGKYNDGSKWWTAGDFVRSDDEVEHDVRVSSDGPCVCLLATQAPLRWKGWAKVLTPVLDL